MMNDRDYPRVLYYISALRTVAFLLAATIAFSTVVGGMVQFKYVSNGQFLAALATWVIGAILAYSVWFSIMLGADMLAIYRDSAIELQRIRAALEPRGADEDARAFHAWAAQERMAGTPADRPDDIWP